MNKKILVISEDRLVLKKVDQYLSTGDKIKYNLHSCNAFKFFVENQPDLVIMDTNISTDYEELIEKFLLCQWEYNLILLTEASVLPSSSEQIIYLNKNSLETATFAKYLTFPLKRDRLQVKPSSQEVIFRSDGSRDQNNGLVSAIFAKSTENRQEPLNEISIRELKAVVLSISQVEEISITNRDIFIVISNRDRLFKEKLKQISTYIFQYFSPHYSIFALEDIVHSSAEFEDIQNRLAIAQSLSYFCEGEVNSLNEITDLIHKDIPYEEIDRCVALIMASILQRTFNNLDTAVDNLYTVVKSCRNGLAQKYLNFMMNMLFSTLSTLTSIKKNYGEYTFKSCETEFQLIRSECVYFTDVTTALDINIVLKKSLIFIYQHLSENISLSSASNELCISKNYISKWFSTLNTTFLRYLNNLKLEKAKFLLKESDLKVFQVANMLGFSDRHYFSRVFKSNFNISPEEYRATRKEL